jgi:hypothetical protein
MRCADGERDVSLVTSEPRSFLDNKPMTDAHGLYYCAGGIKIGYWRDLHGVRGVFI